MSQIQLKLIIVFITTVVADILFYGHIIGGLSIGVYSCALLLGIIVSEREFFASKKVVWLSFINITLIIANIIRPNFWSLSLLVLCFFTIMIILRKQMIVSAFELCYQWFLSFCFIFIQWIKDLPILKDWIIRPKGLNLKGYLIALVFSSFFIVMFSIANPIIEVWLIEILDKFILLPEFARFFFWFSFLVCTWSYFRLQYPEKKLEQSIEIQEDTIDKQDKEEIAKGKPLLINIFTPSTIMICLVMFNAIFAIQNILDIVFLWRKFELPDGMTYAKYAHRGSYPLVFTVLLAAFFVLLTFRDQAKSKDMYKARFLVYVWLLQNVFLTISAFLRLELYIEVYTLTRWRVAALIWMGIVAIGLIWILVRILKEKSSLWLVNINFATVFLVFYICAFSNIDGFIANYNVNHNQFQNVDIEYLESLGLESLPALSKFIISSPQDSFSKQQAIHAQEKLKIILHNQLSNWRGWCYYYYLLQKQK